MKRPEETREVRRPPQLSVNSGSSPEAKSSSTIDRIERKVRQQLFETPPRVDRLGRYVLIGPIGRGGMGMVYAAYDEQLDRKVAIKVLPEDELPSTTDRLRFIREGQALARLSHPNVVTVHEVGETQGRSFLAMEFIRGQSLSAWLRTGPPWQQVVGAFVQAGHGLAEAHAAGLVHRDFKPQNVMRTEEGRVKVLDFGLARVSTIIDEQTHDDGRTGSHSVLNSELTLAGTMVGTPAYMAPEQFDAESTDQIDARSDQYSFCVALWEGLTGTRPFVATTMDDLFELKQRGAPPWPADGPFIPTPIVETLRRGLAASPEDRWPSMEALLLGLAPRPRRSRQWGLGLAALAAVGIVGAGVQSLAEDPAQPCRGAEAKLEGVWDETRRGEVQTALLAIDRPFAPAVADATTEGIDAYANDWVTMHTQACEATAVHKEQSSRLLDLRMACLVRAVEGLDATVDTLTKPDQTVASRAHELVASLPPLDRCADKVALEAETEPPLPAEAEMVSEGWRQLDRAKSLRIAGHYEAAEGRLEEASVTLEGVSYAPLRAELVLERAIVSNLLGRADAAVPMLEQALELALQHGQRRTAASAVRRLVITVGVIQKQAKAALRLRSVLLGLVRGDPLAEAKALNAIGEVLLTDGDSAGAEREHRAALALQEPLLSPDHMDVATTRRSIGHALNAQGQYARAETEHRAHLAACQKQLGPQHPTVAGAYVDIAGDLAYQDEHEEAVDLLRTARVIADQALGPEHPLVLLIRHNLGCTFSVQRKYAEAEAELRAVEALQLEVLGPDHPDVTQTRGNLAAVLSSLGKTEEVERLFRSVIAALERTRGPDHPEVALARMNLGTVFRDQGKLGVAETMLRQAVASLEKSQGPYHRETTLGRANLAKLLTTAGRHEEALSLSELAWRDASHGDIPGTMLARLARVLATALWDVEGPKRDRPRARELVQDQLVSARESGNELPIEDLEQWLKDHPLP